MIDIRKRREALGLTTSEVAEMVDVSQATITRWENGQIANMKRNHIVNIANALKVSPLDLLVDEVRTPEEVNKDRLVHLASYEPYLSLLEERKKVRELVECMKSSSDEDIDFAITILKGMKKRAKGKG